MLYKSLILGVLFSIGIFAIKSGVGIAYVSTRKQRWRGFLLIALLYALAYGIVFTVVALVLPWIDPVRHLGVIHTFMQSGMLIHLALAMLMLGWGIVLLKQPPGGYPNSPASSRGWLVLALPCPVCMTVILLSSAFLLTCFPDHPVRVVLALYLTFVTLGLLSMGIVHRVRQLSAVSSEAFLGAVMLLLSAYFLVSVTVMPQFGDLDKVYRLASYPDDGPSMNLTHLIGMIVFAVTAFGTGFGVTVMKTRRLR